MEQSTTKKKLQNHQDNFIIKNSTMMDLIVEKSHKIGENNQLMEQKTTSRLHVANFEKKNSISTHRLVSYLPSNLLSSQFTKRLLP